MVLEPESWGVSNGRFDKEERGGEDAAPLKTPFFVSHTPNRLCESPRPLFSKLRLRASHPTPFSSTPFDFVEDHIRIIGLDSLIDAAV